MKLPIVLVLMSTYNGEKYLKEQIESLISQRDVEVNILIRDDGSKDRTLEIIKTFMLDFVNIKLIEGSNIGSARSFMSLVKLAEQFETKADYYAFCDQDDVWLNNKLSVAVSKIEKYVDSPAMYCSSTKLVDKNLNHIKSVNIEIKSNLGESMIINCAVGCTIVFNKGLLDLTNLYTPKFLLMHDGWLYRLCLVAGGEVFYDKNSYILYRQHENNVVGGKSNFLLKWKRRFDAYYHKQSNVRYKTAVELLKGYENQMSNDTKCFLLQIVNYKTSFKERKSLIFNSKFKTNSREHNFMFKLSVLFGLY